MSKVALQGNVSGTGTVTIVAPNTNANRTLNLPDGDGTLVEFSGATTNLPTGSITNNNLAFDGGAFGFRNRAINGATNVWQIGTTGGVGYVCDCFIGGHNSAGTFTCNKDSYAPSGFMSSIQVLSTNITAGQYLRVTQNIERLNIADVAVGDVVTVSFWYRSSNNEGTVRSYIGYPTSTDNFSALDWPSNATGVSKPATSAWTRYVHTYTVAAGASGHTPASGLQVIMEYTPATSGAREFQVTGLQVEKGSVATPFEHRPYGLELDLCRYYFEILGSSAAEFIGVGKFNSSTQYDVFINYSVKRAIPTITFGNITDGMVMYGGGGLIAITSYTSGNIGLKGFRMYGGCGATGSATGDATMICTNTGSFKMSVSARL